MESIKLLTSRNKSAHKGQSGHVLLIAGSEDYVGAVILAGLAALRSGCDIVTVAAPEKVAWAVNCYSPDLITKKLKGKYLTADHYKIILPLLKKCNVLAIGNGIGTRNETKKLCKLLMKNKLPKVIDADAIKLLKLEEINNAIITPHKKEFEIFLKNSGITRPRQHLKNNIILLKGHEDKIITKFKTTIIRGGNPGLAKAGTGDVLAGLCAGFLAQSGKLLDSAVAASRLNKQIGDILLRKKHGYSFIASDIVEEIERLSTQFLK